MKTSRCTALVGLFLSGTMALLFPVAAPGLEITSESAVVIIIPDTCPPVVAEAARELDEHLKLVLPGCLPEIVAESKQKDAAVRFILGDTQSAAQQKMSGAGLPAEGFQIKIGAKDIHIVGNDDPQQNLDANYGARGTLYGVYDFLERYAGVRWYFPGPYGLAAAPKAKIEVPAGDRQSSPCLKYRTIYTLGFREKDPWGTAGFNKDNPLLKIDQKEIAKWWRRARLGGAYNIPANHTTEAYQFLKRFKDSRPDFFAMRQDGSLFTGESGHDHFLRWGNPDVVDEHVRLALDYYSNEKKILQRSAKESGIYFGIMPNDSYMTDYAPESMKRIKTIESESGNLFNTSDLIFWHLNEVAKRVRETYPQAIISTCAYSTYKYPPSFSLEKNVQVRLCIEGPYSVANPAKFKKELELIQAWKEKAPLPLSLWTYQLAPLYHFDQFGAFTAHCPRLMSTYYRAVKPYFHGMFMENESQYVLREHVNRYVGAKLMWDPEANIDDLLNDYYASFYGPAAKPMGAFFEKLEVLWTAVCKRSGWLSTELWTQVYTPTALADLDASLKKAVELAPEEPFRTRVAWIKEYSYDKLMVDQKKYQDLFASLQKTEIQAKRAAAVTIDGKLDEEVWQKAAAVELKNAKDFSQEVPAAQATKVRTAWDKDNLYIAFECFEPQAEKMYCRIEQNDVVDIWQDSGVEIFINPDIEQEQSFYQFIVNAKGYCYDARLEWMPDIMMRKTNPRFTADAKIKTVVGADRWTAEIAIPVAALKAKIGDGAHWRINFNRNRRLAGWDMKEQELYSWSNTGGNFHSPDRFGRIVFRGE